MRFPKLSTLGIAALAATIFPTVGLLAYAHANRWMFNNTTCMNVGFYTPGPKPAHIADGTKVFLCPSLQNTLHLQFTGLQKFQHSLQPGTNPALAQAMQSSWLDRNPHAVCPGNLVPFAKIVVATAGQTVQITKAGVIANGRLLPNSKVVSSVDGMPVIHLPIGFKMVIPKGYFWDYAPGNFAYTSAYYGPEPIKNILGSLHPALVIPGSEYWYHPSVTKE